MRQSGGLTGVSFVVRLWLESRGHVGEPEWRFEVRHVQSGTQMHGRCMADLLAFVERLAGLPAPRLSTTAHGAEEVHS